MHLLENFCCVEQLHSLILERRTGTPKQFAQKLGISRTKLYVLLDDLESINLPVSYSRKFETFYYKKEVDENLISTFKSKVSK